MKVPNANELIPMVQSIILDYKFKSEELDKSQAEIEVITNENLETRKQLRTFHQQSVNILNKLQEKIKVAEKLEELCMNFERLSDN